MKTEDAVALIRSSVQGHEGTWADLGAGRGTFTRALVELLGRDARVYSVDRNAESLAELATWAKEHAPNVQVTEADFTEQSALEDLPALDGVLLANSLHFVKDAGAVLRRIARRLKPGGRVVLVEYDRVSASRWTPYPIQIADLRGLAKAAELPLFTVAESRPSNYEGTLYAAYSDRAAS